MSEEIPGGLVVPVKIEDEFEVSYLRYSMSVIISRALPDVRDGLKPSQRRILYAMSQLNLSPGAKHRKCAKICGDTSGDYHPHGEQVIYPTLVRMAQDWSMRYRLVDGQGNFGSIDGDPPAAMRYTEARLTDSAMDLLADMEKGTVDMVPNYDETRTEPTIMPSKFPNLLANGSSGIAVGMATNIPPHNVLELISALELLVKEPATTIDEIMEKMPAPDFPTGGIICGREGVISAYRTGRGKIILRAKIDIVESTRAGRQTLEVKEIPYGVNKSELIMKIADLVNEKKITGISDIVDLSDKKGMCIAIELKKDESPEVIKSQLFKHTSLQVTFGANMLALVNGLPKTLNIKQLMQHWIDHRIEVIRRRTRFELAKAEARAHILQGLIIAVTHLDEVVALIRQSKNRPEAQEKLMEVYDLSERQADAVLDLRLHRLTGLERDEIRNELLDLQVKIAYYQDVLAHEHRVREIICDELKEIGEQKAHRGLALSKRQTQIEEDNGAFSMEDLLANEQEILTISTEDYVKRMSVAQFREQRRGGVGVAGIKEDLKAVYAVKTHDTLLVFTNKGRCYSIRTWELHKGERGSKGRPLINFIDGYKPGEGERVATILPVTKFNEQEACVLFATKNGIVKKTKLELFSNVRQTGIYAINIDDGDALIDARYVKPKDEVMLFTYKGQAIRFDSEEVNPTGRQTYGVTGARFKEPNDYVVSCEIVPNADEKAVILIACEGGKGKRSLVEDFRKTGRGAKGVISIETAKNGNVVGARLVGEGDRLMVMTGSGQAILMPLDEVRIMGRKTQGVRLVRLEDNDSIRALQKITFASSADAEELN